jgi:hypothetical protein
MSQSIRTRLAQFLGVALALFAGSAVAAALPHDSARQKVAVVVAGAAAENANSVVRARAAAEKAGAQVRVVHTTSEQLGATHLLAAQGYEKIVTVGVDRRDAIVPVQRRYPATEFVDTDPRGVSQALQRN